VTRVLYALGRWCAEHAVLVLVLWLSLLGGVRLADRVLPPPALDPFVLAGTDSASAQTLLNRAFPGTAAEPVPLLVADDRPLDEGAGAALVDDLAAAVLAVEGVNAVRGPADDADLLAVDRRTAILQLTLAERAAGDPAVGTAILETAQTSAEAVAPTARVALGGYIGQQISRTDTRPSEALGLALAVIVLLLTLRRGWPVVIPLATAIVAVGIGLATIGLLGRLVYIPDEAPTLGTMLGLGVGIDYALFLVTRHRTLLRRGFAVDDAVGRTAGTAGAGMVFAGATLLTAVTGLALTGIAFLAWLGYTAAIVVAVALAAALTLVPALLGLLGHRVLRRADAQALAAGELDRDRPDEELDRGGWARLANTVTGRPWPFAIAATLVLLLMAAPMLTMQFQQADASALPDDTTAHQAHDLVTEAFGPGSTGPLAIVGQLHRAATTPDEGAAPADAPDAPADPRAADPRIVTVTDQLRGTAGIAEVADPVVSPDGGVVIWRATPETGPSDKATEELVGTMRTVVLPAATEGADMTAYVGGITAARTDLSVRIAERLVPFIVGVATLSFLLLMLAYRSLVIPLKAAAMNLLSISAAYGVVVAVFQWGWGAELIGLDGPVPIESYVPMMMFAVLFGLSMDYEVFLLTAFTEHFQRSGDIVTAVRRGLADTGQLITAAALIMVVVFASFILPDNAIVKMFGVGLATAVLVDATIVRCVLVPSLMVLAARWTWWLPGWLDRALPHLHVEGDPAQLEGVAGPRPVGPRDHLPSAGRAALVAGTLVGWVAGAAVAIEPSPAVGAAIALAAAGGGVLAYVPRSSRAASAGLGVRLLAMLVGALVAGTVFLLVRGLTPATADVPVLQTGLALLVPLALAVLTPLRRVALPVGLGAAAATAGMVAGGGPQLFLVLVPAVAAAVSTRVLTALGRALRGGGEPAEPHVPRLGRLDDLKAGSAGTGHAGGAAPDPDGTASAEAPLPAIAGLGPSDPGTGRS
jgi:RND superfamily putative drug exporter